MEQPVVVAPAWSSANELKNVKLKGKVSRADWPKFVTHRFAPQEKPVVWRPIKGLLIRAT